MSDKPLCMECNVCGKDCEGAVEIRCHDCVTNGRHNHQDLVEFRDKYYVIFDKQSNLAVLDGRTYSKVKRKFEQYCREPPEGFEHASFVMLKMYVSKVGETRWRFDAVEVAK